MAADIEQGSEVRGAAHAQAYTQAKLEGTETWVRLPVHEWPKAWEGMRDPVCRLRLALYGHPDSGGGWEEHKNYMYKIIFSSSIILIIRVE